MKIAALFISFLTVTAQCASFVPRSPSNSSASIESIAVMDVGGGEELSIETEDENRAEAEGKKTLVAESKNLKLEKVPTAVKAPTNPIPSNESFTFGELKRRKRQVTSDHNFGKKSPFVFKIFPPGRTLLFSPDANTEIIYFDTLSPDSFTESSSVTYEQQQPNSSN